MKKTLTKFKQIFYSEFELNLPNQFIFYVVILLLYTCFFSVFMIYPSIKSIRALVLLREDLRMKQAAISENTQKFEIEEQKIKDLTAELSLLDAYFPKGTELNNYMVEFISAASVAGFSVDKINASPAAIEESLVSTTVMISLQGSFEKILDLVKAIENLKRITEINKLSFSPNFLEGTTDVDISVTIYSTSQ
jgi:Tfp pilus assembly protein PilO